MNAIAYWLLPAEPARKFFAQMIRKLATRFEAPVFDPHLTLFVGSENSWLPTDILSGIKEISLRLSVVDIRFSEQFTKTLFVQFDRTDAAQKLSETVAERSGANERFLFDPHLSLLYKNLSRQVKLELASSIELPFRNVTFDSICAVRCASPTLSAEDVRVWQLLATQERERSMK